MYPFLNFSPSYLQDERNFQYFDMMYIILYLSLHSCNIAMHTHSFHPSACLKHCTESFCVAECVLRKLPFVVEMLLPRLRTIAISTRKLLPLPSPRRKLDFECTSHATNMERSNEAPLQSPRNVHKLEGPHAVWTIRTISASLSIVKKPHHGINMKYEFMSYFT